MASGIKSPDLLDTTVAFLAKREGIDKTLKIIRYTTRLLLSTALAGSSSELAARLKAFESSVGTSRKAYRLGKFLGDVNTLRKTRLHGPYAWLEWVAAGGNGCYYFMEQFTWLVKAGLLPERYAAPLSRVSNWGELIGYLGSITLSMLRISLLLEREVALVQELQRLKQKAAEAGGEGEEETAAKALRAEVALLRARRVLRTLGLVQDLADLLMVLPEVRTPRKGSLLTHGSVLALAGLVSACCSAYKNWPRPG